MPEPRYSVDPARLHDDPVELLARAREVGAVVWVPQLAGWLVTGYHAAATILRDWRRFTVDDPRFSTARLTGPSMLTLDGREHDRHRAVFAERYRARAISDLTEAVTNIANGLVNARAHQDRIEVRSELARPLAIAVLTDLLGLANVTAADVERWYVGLADAFEADALGQSVPLPIDAMRSHTVPGPLDDSEQIGNAAIMMLGGIETVEGMICHAAASIWSEVNLRDGVDLDRAIDESLRLDPAAARLDRYATEAVTVGNASIAAGDLVIISLIGANRDPTYFADPNQFSPDRSEHGRHLGFAVGPHYCLGVHLARLEARSALNALRLHFAGALLDQSSTDASRGLVFRKPDRVSLVRP
ncbi:MAG: cytochrome P450 [Antricoccus sp.]